MGFLLFTCISSVYNSFWKFLPQLRSQTVTLLFLKHHILLFYTQVKRTQLIILKHCADLGVGRHKVIKPPSRTALTISEVLCSIKRKTTTYKNLNSIKGPLFLRPLYTVWYQIYHSAYQNPRKVKNHMGASE